MPLKQGSVQLFRNNFLTNTDNINILSLVLGVQFTGLLCALVFLTLKRQQFQNKVAFFVSLSIMVIATIITFFVFGLSMSLRNIGF
jgi:predicted cation transporter